MSEIQQLFIRHCKYMLYFLAIYVLGWGFTEYKTIFMGLILGTVVSLYNHWNLYRKTKRLGLAVTEGKKVYGMGMLIRMAAVILAVYVAMEFPDVFHLGSVIIGIVTAYAVIMIDFMIQQIFKPRK
ncbi:ATP synthase protein I [Bacillus sp. J14TS2]|uniref:ATP synthase subunit I n=1 Tax=unclassified Bacillus (in: firmicutes) TaxID=185979 RepID=UPI001A965AB6|nr:MULTISPECIES: ATP synthase subunit I [unclassified Bacillus (in: firmicutes)]MBO0991565.1 ATP synthase subunit I [Bacillus sp. SD088]GIN69747.1 ATP synthase protein I [Bacillus sp. J14TS2]